MIIPRLSDSHFGRKGPYVICLAFQTLFHLVLLFSKSIWLNIFMYFLIGICAGGRVCVGLSYQSEFIPENYRNITSSMFLTFDALVLTYQGLFYMIVPDWFYVHGVAILISILLICTEAYYVPESPKYMYAK
jgi:MFS family permease